MNNANRMHRSFLTPFLVGVVACATGNVEFGDGPSSDGAPPTLPFDAGAAEPVSANDSSNGDETTTEDEETTGDDGGMAPEACVPSCTGMTCGDDGCGGSCGSCSNGYTCQSGSCACATTLCGGDAGVCVDTTSDSNNCGACGVVCPSGTSCQLSKCLCTGATTCPAVDGGIACVNTSSDTSNCGACGIACNTAGSEICWQGKCGCGPGPYQDCNHICSSPMSDNNNCGTCGHACTGGTTCLNGICK